MERAGAGLGGAGGVRRWPLDAHHAWDLTVTRAATLVGWLDWYNRLTPRRLRSLAVRSNARSNGPPSRRQRYRERPLVHPRWLVACALASRDRLLALLTLIGIPLGIADVRMAGAALVPFGKEIVRLRDFHEPPAGSVVVPSGR